MAAPKARLCYVPAASPSEWVHAVFLTCDNVLGVWFKRGQRCIARPTGPKGHKKGRYVGIGGAPAFCCLYPTTQGALAKQLFDLAVVWGYAGEWVHTFLFKKLPYVPCAPPDLSKCGQCNTNATLGTSVKGTSVQIAVAITNNDGGSAGEEPWGEVSLSVDGTPYTTITIPEPTTSTTNVVTVQAIYTCTDNNTHTVSAVFTPGKGSGLSGCSASSGFDCSGGSSPINDSCCNSFNEVVTLLLYGDLFGGVCTCFGGGATVTLVWNATEKRWIGQGPSPCVPDDGAVTYQLYCSDSATKQYTLTMIFANSGSASVNPTAYDCTGPTLTFNPQTMWVTENCWFSQGKITN